MKAIGTVLLTLLLAGAARAPASAMVYGGMYCWVPDFEIAVACDDEDESGDGDETVRAPVPPRSRGTR